MASARQIATPELMATQEIIQDLLFILPNVIEEELKNKQLILAIKNFEAKQEPVINQTFLRLKTHQLLLSHWWAKQVELANTNEEIPQIIVLINNCIYNVEEIWKGKKKGGTKKESKEEKIINAAKEKLKKLEKSIEAKQQGKKPEALQEEKDDASGKDREEVQKDKDLALIELFQLMAKVNLRQEALSAYGYYIENHPNEKTVDFWREREKNLPPMLRVELSSEILKDAKDPLAQWLLQRINKARGDYVANLDKLDLIEKISHRYFDLPLEERVHYLVMISTEIITAAKESEKLEIEQGKKIFSFIDRFCWLYTCPDAFFRSSYSSLGIVLLTFLTKETVEHLFTGPISIIDDLERGVSMLKEGMEQARHLLDSRAKGSSKGVHFAADTVDEAKHTGSRGRSLSQHKSAIRSESLEREERSKDNKEGSWHPLSLLGSRPRTKSVEPQSRSGKKPTP